MTRHRAVRSGCGAFPASPRRRVPPYRRDNVTTAERRTKHSPPLADVVERLAADYEAETGMRPIVIAVRQARDTILLLAIDEADGGLGLVERVARQQLDLLTGRAEDTARLMPTRRSSRRQLDEAAESHASP